MNLQLRLFFFCGVMRWVRALFQQFSDCGVRQLINGIVDVVDVGFGHGFFLFFGDYRVRIDPKQEREEGIDEFLLAGDGHIQTELGQQSHDRPHGVSVGNLELHQGFHAAVLLQIVVIHGENLQQLFPMLQGVGDGGGDGVIIHGLVFCRDLIQFLDPPVVFSFEQCQEDLFLGLKIIIDRRSGKRRLRCNIL